jgi:hypothetical protein
MADTAQIIRDNVQKMVNAGAPPAHINGYLKQQGLTPEQFKASMSAPQPPTPEQTQAQYLRSGVSDFENLTGIETIDSQIKAGRGSSDYIQEVSNTPLDRALGAAGSYADAGMFGGADEALAGIESLPYLMPGGQSFADKFKLNLSRLEQKRRDYESLNKAEATAAEIAGIVGNPLNVVGGEFIAAGRTAPARIGRATGLGSGTGTVTGGLSTEGGVEERATGAAIGTVLGGAAGLVGQPGAELLGLGGKKATEGARAILNTLRNQSQAHSNPDLQADRLLARAFLQDQLQLGHGPAPLPNALPGQGLINMGGENVQKLGRLSTVAPGAPRQKAADFFENQSQSAADRAADAVGELSSRGYYGTVETLDATRKAAAKPLYEAAYARPAVDAWTPRIGDLMKRPSMRAAFAKAQRIAAEEGRNPKELGLDFNQAGDPQFLAGADELGQIPSTQTMDYVKRALDDVVEGYRDKTSGKLVLDTEGRAINNTRAEFLGILKEGNPEYKAALEAYAGPSHALDMLEVGRDIYGSRGKPADIIRRFQDLSPQDQELARIGFVRNAVEDLGNVGDSGSVYLKLFGNQNKRAVAQVLFPDEASFNKFAQQMKAEKEMLAANRSTLGGSPTSRIDAEKADAAMQGASDVLSFAQAIKSGNPLQLLGLAVDKAQNLGRGITPEVADALANRLFTNDPVQIQRVLSRVGAVPAPAPQTALQPGLTQFGRRTPLVPLAAMFGGQAGAAIATPPLGR